ncbi:PAS domain-containing protein [Tsukamurella soli]|uniref:PAS domain-containing protein n=1 Tax=Tsukamurella soli TaxID=644556 RepID=UPI003617E7DF
MSDDDSDAQAWGRGQWWLDPSLESHPDCIKVIGLDGALLHMNGAGRTALQTSAEDITRGVLWVDLLPASARGKGRRALVEAAGGAPSHFLGRTGDPDGRATEIQRWDNLLVPLTADDGERRILCVSREITYAHVRNNAFGLDDARGAETGQEQRWVDGFSRLVEHVEESGSVPPSRHVTADGYRLGAWMMAQRSAHKEEAVATEICRARVHPGVAVGPPGALVVDRRCRSTDAVRRPQRGRRSAAGVRR